MATDAVIKPGGSQGGRGSLMCYNLQEAGSFLSGNSFPLQ